MRITTRRSHTRAGLCAATQSSLVKPRPHPAARVTRNEAPIRTLQAPGRSVVTNKTAGRLPHPANAPVGHAHVHAPLAGHLPVGGAEQALTAQHLRAGQEAVRVEGAGRLRPPHTPRPPPVSRQPQLRPGRVGVKGQGHRI